MEHWSIQLLWKWNDRHLRYMMDMISDISCQLAVYFLLLLVVIPLLLGTKRNKMTCWDSLQMWDVQNSNYRLFDICRFWMLHVHCILELQNYREKVITVTTLWPTAMNVSQSEVYTPKQNDWAHIHATSKPFTDWWHLLVYIPSPEHQLNLLKIREWSKKQNPNNGTVK